MKTSYPVLPVLLGILGAVIFILVVSVIFLRASSSGPYIHYRTCEEARASGVGPFHTGDPRYRPELDRNGDGMACE